MAMLGTQVGGGIGGGAGGGIGGGAGACAACGTCGETTEVISWVGEGGGSYIQETTYKYVGKGAGDFETVEVGGSRWFICVGCGAGVLVLAALLLWLLLPSQDTSTSTRQPFDCNAGFANWQTGWNDEKKAYCCAETGRGCPVAPAPPTIAPAPPTIAPAPPTTAAPIATTPNQCNEGAVDTWPEAKRVYCCAHYKNGCPGTPAPPPAPMPYDCNAGFANWQLGWSVGKKAWCCQHAGKGCPLTTGGCVTSAPYDCNAGFANWQAGWSVGKKAWCCQHTGKGCPPKAGGCA